MSASSSYIGRYEILAKIGEGSLSICYQAHDPKTGRKLAIKLLKDNAALDEFIRESRMIGKLSHHNIVTIYDVGEHQGHAFIAMELLQGAALDLVMRRQPRMRWSLVVELAKQLASALEYAHNLGVMHGDIRPANIIYDEASRKVILTDFGNAKQADIYQTHTLRVNEVSAATPYLSPERILGQQADQRSDLYSLGCVLYQMLSGEKPFDSPDFEDLTTQITQRAHKAISVSVNQVPEQLIHIVDRLLYKNPRDRIQSASELLRELNDLPEDYQLPTARGHKRLLGISLAALVTASFAFGVYIIVSPPPEIHKPVAQQQQASAPALAPAARLTKAETARKQTSLEASINQSLSKFECSSLAANVNADKQVVIRGHVSLEEDLISVMDMMDSYPGVSNVTYEVNALKWPFCEAVSILSVDKHQNVSNKKGLKLAGISEQIAQGNAKGEKVKFEVDTPDFDAYVYLDYYQSNGTVRHLLPDVGKQGTRHAKSKLSFDATLDVANDGEGLFVAIASYNPLTGNRPSSEPAQQYLAELHKQVVVNKVPLASDYLLLENIETPNQ